MLHVKHSCIVILSFIMLVSLCIVPFSTGFLLGIIPEANDLGEVWVDIFHEIDKEGTGAFKNIVVTGTLFAFLFSVMLFIGSIGKVRSVEIVSSVGGLISLTWFLIKYISYNDLDAVFDLDNCGTTIGFWIPYIIFLICFLISIKEDTNIEIRE